MKIHLVCATVLIFAFCGCGSPPAGKDYPTSVVIEADVIGFYGIGNRIRASEFQIPAGRYARFHMTSDWVLYLSEKTQIKKHWLSFDRPDRLRKGGILVNRYTDEWSVFTLGPASDLREDGMPEVGLLFPAKADGLCINLHGKLGRTDRMQVTRIESHWFGEGRFFGVPVNLQYIHLIFSTEPNQALL